MKKIIRKIKVSDVSLFGVLALTTTAIAVLSANMPSLISPKLSSIMHSNIHDGASLGKMQAQVAQLQDLNIKMNEEYRQMIAMIKLAEQGQGDVTKRIGAMESSLPLLLEALPPGVQIDNSISTASIDNVKNSKKIEADGGYAIVSKTAIENSGQPIIQNIPQEITTIKLDQPLKEPDIISNGAFGIALGNEIKLDDVIASWRDIETKVGTLLLGLEPILSVKNENEEQKIITGPIEDYSQAEQLCTRITRVGISCLPVPYEGQKMPE